jgi:hypothetical protein
LKAHPQKSSGDQHKYENDVVIDYLEKRKDHMKALVAV